MQNLIEREDIIVMNGKVYIQGQNGSLEPFTEESILYIDNDLESDENEQDFDDVLEKIILSNVTNGVTTERMQSAVRNSKTIPMILNNTKEPNLLQIPERTLNYDTEIVGSILGGEFAIIIFKLGWMLWHKKKREGVYRVQKKHAQNV